MFSKIKNLVKNIHYMYTNNSPFYVILIYLKGVINKLNLRKYSFLHDDFLKFHFKKMKIDNDYYTLNYINWSRVINNYRNDKLKILEIGSFEGLSSSFFLFALPNSKIYCVDTWLGSDEQNANKNETSEVLNKVEKNFDYNLNLFGTRLKKFKMNSYDFFAFNKVNDVFDICYVDGSHHSDTVFIDALNCFNVLKKGGLMIFDDYLWKYYNDSSDNPALAINLFLNFKRKKIQVLDVYHQLIIRKID